ncbi:MAG: hemolysin family protein [Parachlamydiales bacterium]|nr:hemolysin family protein [Parachlamydiales bacterium]
MILESPIIPILLLLGSLILTACNSAILHLGKFKSKELLRSAKGAPLLFFRPILRKFFRQHEWENLYFCISISKHIYELAYAITAFFYLISALPGLHHLIDTVPTNQDWPPLLSVGGSIIAVSVVLEFTMRLIGNLWCKPILKIFSPFASIYLTILFPLVGLFLKLTRVLIRKTHFEEEGEIVTDQSKIREMIRESELQQHLDPSDQKLISSFVNFKERVAKEVMVPRVDVYALSGDTPLKEAAKLFSNEGYSRIPIYRETLDDIVGVALYKDLLKCFADPEQDLSATVETIAKPVLYAPENKKIALLLQEFRNKQIHMAIIVDEYGGTEGIVTIEDILEELVGEIEDEYDIGEAKEFWELPGGSWVVDAKMTLLDIENQIGIKIPENPDYETIGGYVFHCAGTIPLKGWRLSHDEFDLEVLSSNERSIKKIKIIPRPKPAFES